MALGLGRDELRARVDEGVDAGGVGAAVLGAADHVDRLDIQFGEAFGRDGVAAVEQDRVAGIDEDAGVDAPAQDAQVRA